MSKKIEFVAALCMTVSLVTGCTSYSEGSSAAIEGFSEGASEEASEIAASAASEISETSSESGTTASSSSVSSAASSASSKLSSAEVSSKISDVNKNLKGNSESSASASSSDSAVASSSASTSASDSASKGKSSDEKTKDKTKDKSDDKKADDKNSSDKKTDDKSKAKKASKNGILTPEIEDGITKIGDRGVEVTFEWEPDDDVDRYEVSVEGKARDSESYSYIENLYTDKPSYSYQDKLNYDIRIKVRAYKGDVKKEVCSEWSEFAFGNTYEDSLEAPKVKDGVARKGANGTEVYFAWEAVEGAEHYEVVVEHKRSDESEYDIKEVTYTNAPNYTYSANGNYDVRITVKAQTNAWINGKKKVFNSKVSSYAKGKTY